MNLNSPAQPHLWKCENAALLSVGTQGKSVRRETNAFSTEALRQAALYRHGG